MGQMTADQYLDQIQNQLMKTLTEKKDAMPPGFNQQRFALNCITVIRDMMKDYKKREQLQTVDINSIVLCMIKGAYLGLDFLNGECYAIPYKGEMTFQTDYKGEIKVCKRFSDDPIKDIYAKVVREGDVYDEGVEAGVQKLSFKPVPFSNKNIIGAFAVVMYADGTIKYDSMSVEEIQHTKDVYSKAANSQAWKESFGEMCKKTVIRRLSKLIDLNLDKVELIKAYEEGSGFEFENQQISGGSNRQPAQLPGSDNVVDAFAPGQTAGKKTIEQKQQPAVTPQDFRKAPERELIPAEEAPQSMPEEGFMMPEDFPDNEFGYDRSPYPSWALQNNLANIKRCQQRVDELKKTKEKGTSEADYGDFKVIENIELMRIQIVFDGKPDEAIRSTLKSNGFRWAPSQGAWQRQLTSNGKYALRKVIEELGAEVQAS